MKELTPLFKRLRKMGFDARQRFMCCSGCAGSAIANEYLEKVKVDPMFARTKKGFIFNHAQDQYNERELEQMAYREQQVKVAIRFGPVEVSDGKETIATVGLSAKAIGDIIVEACKAENMDYLWDGDPDKCIFVLPFGRVLSKAEKKAKRAEAQAAEGMGAYI